MSAIFNFEALLLVLLLSICTATFLKDQPFVGPRMEANKFGCVPAGPPAPRPRAPIQCSQCAAHPVPPKHRSRADRLARWMLRWCSVQDSSVTWNSLWKLSRIGATAVASLCSVAQRRYRFDPVITGHVRRRAAKSIRLVLLHLLRGLRLIPSVTVAITAKTGASEAAVPVRHGDIGQEAGLRRADWPRERMAPAGILRLPCVYGQQCENAVLSHSVSAVL